MCGPIVLGLQLDDGNGRWGAVRGLVAYQLGRSLMYGLFGGLAGVFGSEILERPELGWILVFVMGVLLVSQFVSFSFERFAKTPAWLMRAVQAASSLPRILRAFLFGVLFSFLPCMLAFWALTVAASTLDFFRGALVMILLVLMTTLPLLAFILGVRKLFGVHQKWATQVLLSVSFLWTTLVTLAANHHIAHQHFIFEVFGKTYTLMFW